MSRPAHRATDARLARAIRQLGRLRSSDPAARHAMHAVALTRLTLERYGAPHDPPADGDGAGVRTRSARPIDAEGR